MKKGDKMAYPMTHLYIAKKMLDNSLIHIDNVPQYFLGSIVPDAVEWRKTYDKRISHLCNDEEKWGFITDYENWSGNVLEYFEQTVKTNDRDFFTGYCFHILADINHSIKIWTPFRIKNENKTNFNEINKICHDEEYIVDLELYQKCSDKDEILNLLKESKCMDFMDLVYKDEMEKTKNNVLNIQYNKKRSAETKRNKIISYGKLLEYINTTIEYITEKIKGKSYKRVYCA
jgi:hypothetical protein